MKSAPRFLFDLVCVALCCCGMVGLSGLVACTLENDSSGVVLPDDDDVGGDDDDAGGDDDSSGGGDDDSSGGGDDDSSGGGDDDSDPGPGPGPLVITWLIERLDLVDIDTGDTTLFGRAAFDAASTGSFGNPLDDDGLPLPGAGLQSERRAALLEAVAPDVEGCVPIATSDPWITPSSSDDAGSPVLLTSGGTTIELVQDDAGGP